MNYFQLFNLPEQFDIDLQTLKLQYQTLQKLTHPDRFASSSVQEKRMYLQKNADVNNGFDVLKSPVSRGEHLLECRGFELADEQQTLGDTSFLMQQMTLREALAEASETSDFAQLEQEVNELKKQYLELINSAIAENNQNANQNAADGLTKLKFLDKLEIEMRTKCDEVLGF